MRLIATNNGSYPRIGKGPELQVLRRAIAGRDSGKKTDADVKAAEDVLTRAALAEQIASGLDLVTDGQIRWYDPISHLIGKIENISLGGALPFFDTNLQIRQPVVEGPVVGCGSVLRPEYEMATAASSKPVKPVLTGPYTLARHSMIEYPPYKKDFPRLVLDYNEVIAKEVSELAAAGATVIQIDEPSILKDATHSDWDLLEETWIRLFTAKGNARLILATYFGDATPYLHHLLSMPADIIALDFTYNRALADRVVEAKTAKSLGLGLLDGRNTNVEDTATVVQTLEKILPNVRAQECHLNPSSGLEYLPRDRARQKLQRLVEIRDRMN